MEGGKKKKKSLRVRRRELLRLCDVVVHGEKILARRGEEKN